MSRTDVQTVVIGAGAAGLAAAVSLRSRGRDVRVLEAAARPGGVMHTESVGGFLIERGPNTCRFSAPALALVRRAGLEPALEKAQPSSRLRCLLGEEGLVPVPMSPGAFLTTRLLTTRGKLQLLAEPFRRRSHPRTDPGAHGETVAQFITRRLGPEALERLVGPFLVGIYAGDERRLGAEAVFPSLVEWERAQGSIVRGGLMSALRERGTRGLPGTWSGRDGMGGLARLLARELGEALELDSRVAALHREDGAWRLTIEGPAGARELRAESVIVAADAAGAAELLRAHDPELAHGLEEIEYAPLASVALDVDPARATRPIEGFGFLVPRAAGLDLLGALFMSQLFPRRAPPGRELVTALIGGVRWPGVVDADDDEILGRVAKGLERALGYAAPLSPLAVTRWRRAVPQPGPDHPAHVAALRKRLAQAPGIVLAGSYLDGVGVSDTLACGVRAAEALLP